MNANVAECFETRWWLREWGLRCTQGRSKILKTPTAPFYNIILVVESRLWKSYHVRPRGIFSLGTFLVLKQGWGDSATPTSPPPKKKKKSAHNILHSTDSLEPKYKNDKRRQVQLQRNYDDRQKMEQAFWTETRESTAKLRTSKASSVSPIHRALVAQLVEQGAVMREVAGS